MTAVEKFRTTRPPRDPPVSITRRRFLVATGLSLGAATIASSCTGSAIKAREPVLGARDDWSSVRDQFNLSHEYIHLATFSLASHPRPVREAIENYRRTLDENPFLVLEHGLWGTDAENLPRKVREAAAHYVGGQLEEIALTGSTTMGLALVYHGLPIKAGQEILTTAHDFYPHHESIRLAAERAGALMRKIALFDRVDAISEDAIVNRIRSALRPNTRAVGITWVHSASGLKLPVRHIAEAIKEANAGRDESDRILLIVDGVHGFGVEEENVAEMGCDVFVSGTHKWIFAPRGTGIIWAREETWAMLRPTIPSFIANELGRAWRENRAPQGPTRASWVSPGGYQAYEHQWAMIEAFGFHQQIGRKRVAERIHALNEQCKEGLAKMRHVRLYTPRGSALSAGLICFDVNHMQPKSVVKRLFERRIVASTTPYGISYARLAPSLVNTQAEIETVLREIRALSTA
jgi:isopenicillin-N epimerase